MGNPFWNKAIENNDFKTYCSKYGYEGIDLVYVLLSWNGQYIPYNTNFDHHTIYAKKLMTQIHEAYPNAHITLLGIQICSVNGGIGANYYVRYVDTKAQFDSEYNMPMILKKVNTRSTITEYIGTNAVHPTLNGYLQIGDVFYRALVRDIVDGNKK